MKTSYTLTCTEQPSYLALSNLGPVFQGLQNVLLLCGAVVGAYLLYWALERAYLLLKLRNLRKQRITLCADSAKPGGVPTVLPAPRTSNG